MAKSWFVETVEPIANMVSPYAEKVGDFIVRFWVLIVCGIALIFIIGLLNYMNVHVLNIKLW